MSDKPFENITPPTAEQERALQRVSARRRSHQEREAVKSFIAENNALLRERIVSPPVIRPFEQVSDLDEAVRKNAEYLKRLRDA